jgi:putative Holliday junction resolvase
VPDPVARPLVALGFDFGQKRIGIAAGDTLTRGARPLKHVDARNGVPDWIGLLRIVREWDPGILVVGVPCNMDDSPTSLTEAAIGFAAELGERCQRPVVCVDERLSSREAEDQLRRRRSSGERSRRVDRGAIDATAACVLLEQWLRDDALKTQG